MEKTLIIGLEVHVQLLTQTKLFCGCLNRFNPAHPNTQTCPVCLGLPGALPVMNRKAVELSAKAGLALHCEVSSFTKWDRKQYYYPDLPKAYQISQYDLPICHDGYLDVKFSENDEQKSSRVGIIRAHLEEDAGKNSHDESGRGGDSRVDLNRCGTPLLEIVSEPDIRSAAEAKAFLEEMRLLMTYLGVSDCNMQEGSLRCDANVNWHIPLADGHIAATPITEIKNLNSFRGVEAAINYEAHRQREEFERTGRKLGDPGVMKETWGWDADRGQTYLQRGKEDASDYRYFPDPDLVPVTISEEQTQSVRESLGELPADRRQRYETTCELSPYDAGVIIDQGPQFADYFDAVLDRCGDSKQAANWCTQDVQRELNDRQISITEFPITSDTLGTLLQRVVEGKITTASAREIFGVLIEEEPTDQSANRVDELIAERGLEVVNDENALGGVIDKLIADNPKIAEDVRGGKQQAVGPLIGRAMKELKGADPKVVRSMLIERIQSGG